MAAGRSEHGSRNMEYVHTPPNENEPGPHGGFARDLATADGQRVMVTALTWRQFAELAYVTRLATTFAFLERLLHADFSAHRDLHAYRYTIAALLAPWFARRTVVDLTAAFAGTSVP
jgi:2-methylfumaryl-CoA isomerase